jgi:hypothetical protein
MSKLEELAAAYREAVAERDKAETEAKEARKALWQAEQRVSFTVENVEMAAMELIKHAGEQ